MKHFYSLLIALFTVAISAQAQKIWTGAVSTDWQTAGNWSPNGTPGNGDIVTFDGGTSFEVTNVPGTTIAQLRVIGETNVTLKAQNNNDRTLTITGNGTVNRLTIGENSVLTLEHPAGDDFTLDLRRQGGGGTTLATIGGTLILGNRSIADFNNGNTNITVTGAIEVTSDRASVAGAANTLSFSGNGVYRHQRNGGSIPTATWSATSLAEVTGVTNGVPGGLGQDFGHFTWNTPNQSTNLSLAGALTTVRGDFTFQTPNNRQLTLKISSGANTATTVGGNFTLQAGTFSIFGGGDNSTHELRVAGNVNLVGGTLTKSGGSGNGRFVFNGTSVQSFTRNTTTISGAVQFVINNAASVDFGTNFIDGTNASFTVSAGAKVITSSPDGLRSTGTTGSIRTNTRTYSNDAIYEFQGASTGNFTTFGNQVRSLIINNTSGEVAMARTFSVNGSLDLVNGYLTPGANALTVNQAGTSTSVNGAFVNGSMNKVFGAGAAFTFYVGKAGAGLREVGVQTASGGFGNATTFQAEFLPQSASTVSSVLGAGIAKVSQCEYWTVNRTNGTRSATVTLSWSAASACQPGVAYVNNIPTLKVAHYNGTAWVNAGGTVESGSSNAEGKITSDNLSNFSPFALATTSIADNPLPVLFDGVKAFGKGTGVQIEWSNLTERDIVRYQVERSSNGVDFYPVNEQAPKSNRDDKASYSHLDASPVNGTNFYRIRVEEVGGKSIYSKILRVEMGSKNAAFSLYPNPVTGKQFTVSLGGLQQGKYSLEVYSANGQRVYQSTINNVGSGVTQMVELPASIQKGMYVAVVSGDNFRDSKQVIIK